MPFCVCGPVFDYGVDIKYGYGITRGKWLPKNAELFAQHGIDVDFDILGIDYDLYNRANGIKSKSDKPAAAKKKGLREKLYLIKRFVKNLKKKTVKTIRKIRSLI